MSLILVINNECNQGCLFCSAMGRKEKINLDFLLKQIDGEGEMVTISGGEPLLCKNLIKIIKYIKKRNLFCELQSNGTILANIKVAKELVDSGVDLFNVNFPSHVAKDNDFITRTNNYFKYRVKGINNLLKLDAGVRITIIINKINYSYLENIVKYVHKNFPLIKFIQFSFIKIQGSVKDNKEIVVKYKDTEKNLIKCLKYCHNNNIEFMLDHIPMCFLGRYYKKHIDYKKLSLNKDIEFISKEKRKLKICNECVLQNECSGVRLDYIDYFKEKNIILNPVKKL